MNETVLSKLKKGDHFKKIGATKNGAHKVYTVIKVAGGARKRTLVKSKESKNSNAFSGTLKVIKL